MCIELNHDFPMISAAAELGQFDHCVISLAGNYYPELLLRMKKTVLLYPEVFWFPALALTFLRAQPY